MCNLCGGRDELWVFSDLALGWFLDPNFLLDSVAFLSYVWTGILHPGVMRKLKLLTTAIFRRPFCQCSCLVDCVNFSWDIQFFQCTEWGVYRPDQFHGFCQVTVGV